MIAPALPKSATTEAGRAMSLAGLQAVQLEALRRRNYATANCPRWHAVLTWMQQAAMARSAAAYEAFKTQQAHA